MSLPGLVMTGATGFLGRHLLAVLKERWRIYAIARRAPQEVRAPDHPNITWYQADIGDPSSMAAIFDDIAATGGAELVLHFAAHYDFTGEEDPEYERTNVVGLRNVLEHCRSLRPRRFVFTSSVAACDFPPPGRALDETSKPDGKHIYARTKAVGEAMLADYRDAFPTVIVRLGALFSDFCEYPPLYMFLSTWLSSSWKSRVLGGRGQSAIPYIHVRDVVSFFTTLIEREPELEDGEILIASTDGATSHGALFDAATRAYFGEPRRPIHMPKPLSRLGIRVFDVAGRLLGERPFERPWMGAYIDLTMPVDASRTRERLGWRPHGRLEIVRRMPFLVESLKADPLEWHRRNMAAMKAVHVPTHLHIVRLLEAHERELVDRSVAFSTSPEAAPLLPSYRRLPLEELRWAAQQTYAHLKSSIRTREKALFRRHCRDIAARRFRQGFGYGEVVEIVRVKEEICLEVLRRDPHFAELRAEIEDAIGMTFRLGIDEVHDTFEEISGEPIVEGEAPGLEGERRRA